MSEVAEIIFPGVNIKTTGLIEVNVKKEDQGGANRKEAITEVRE